MSHSTASLSQAPSCCSTASSELKLYQTFIFSIPIFFTFLLLLLFYLFYLRRRRVDWSSLRMRAITYNLNGSDSVPRVSESGLNKEFREMLPIIIFNESFSVRDTQCSVCLADYQADDKLQQMPSCAHTFHMECIDHWLSTHTTCPLCRLSLAPVNKTESDLTENQLDAPATEASPDSGSEIGRLRRGEPETADRAEEERTNCVASSGGRREQDEECGVIGETSFTVDGTETRSTSIESGTVRDLP
ncbi:RING-H2 finger protein ATL7-like [Papaver somniferum]|uniref:RING-H2 finger protein ATL7-like n=1 Tax=Papaver somniferum TaxID=3469 RepID=UPI000E6FC00A|nr:RING-H2 finger protein ATL7-like [Papaver somniferum]